MIWLAVFAGLALLLVAGCVVRLVLDTRADLAEAAGVELSPGGRPLTPYRVEPAGELGELVVVGPGGVRLAGALDRESAGAEQEALNRAYRAGYEAGVIDTPIARAVVRAAKGAMPHDVYYLEVQGPAGASADGLSAFGLGLLNVLIDYGAVRATVTAGPIMVEAGGARS